MRVRMISPEFVERVLLPDDDPKAKRQTIRPSAWPTGEPLSLRVWTEKPYRSKQREVAVVECELTEPATVRDHGVELPDAGIYLHTGAARVTLGVFAMRDGFDSWDDMARWFQSRYTLPWSGVVNHFRVLHRTEATP